MIRQSCIRLPKKIGRTPAVLTPIRSPVPREPDKTAHPVPSSDIKTTQAAQSTPADYSPSNQAKLPVLHGKPLAPVRYSDKCFVHLGRYGDLLNILPVIKQSFDTTGIKPTLLVSQEFSSVSGWGSYYNTEVWSGDYALVKPAIEWAKSRFNSVVATQPCTNDFMAEKKCSSFAVESWRLAGCEQLWGRLPLVLDKRNQYREMDLIKRHTSDKMVLISTSGHSSPYRKESELRAALAGVPGIRLVDISGLRVPNIIDFLGLMDRATCLVTTDSAPLHLAVASAVPVVAFITDSPTPWNGTLPRCNLVFSQRYSEAIDGRSIGRIVSRLANRRFVHIFSTFNDKNEENGRRYQRAERTWPTEWEHLPITDDMVRTMDHKPHIKDIISAGVKGGGDDDVIIYTNRDISISSDCHNAIRRIMATRDCVYSFRRDVMAPTGHMDSPSVLTLGIPYDGCDLFAFTAAWWNAKSGSFPDFVIGAPEWDRTLRRVMEADTPGGAGVDGLIYHEWHDPPTLVNKGCRAEKHNLSLATKVEIKPRKSRFDRDVDALRRFYRQVSPAVKHDKIDLTAYALSNNAGGIGDVTILTPLPKAATEQGSYRHIIHASENFKGLMQFNPWYRAYDGRKTVWADVLQTTFNLGNGHFIQRLQRAFDLKPDLVPKGAIQPRHKRINGRCVLHFGYGFHAKWQQQHLHHRAREVYDSTMSAIKEFVFRHHNYLKFFEIGDTFHKLWNVEDYTRKSLADTIDLLSTAEWFIGTVSGPMHLATALGVKCVVILNFPHANQIYLPTLVDINQVESEWLYPQNVHLHQDGDGELVKKFSIRNLELAFEYGIYPYWSQDYLNLINEPL